MENVAEVDLFGRTFKLVKTPEPYRGEEDIAHRWAVEEAGVQLALLRSVQDGSWRAYLHFSEEEPMERHFAFWGLKSEDPDAAIITLQESILSASGLLMKVLRGNTLS